jgi:hypothetical protein
MLKSTVDQPMEVVAANAEKQLESFLAMTPGERVTGVDNRACVKDDALNHASVLLAYGGADRREEARQAMKEAEEVARCRRMAWLEVEIERLFCYHLSTTTLIPHWAWKDPETGQWAHLRKFVQQLKEEGGKDYTAALKEADIAIRQELAVKVAEIKASREAWAEWAKVAGSYDLRRAIADNYPLGKRVETEFVQWLCPPGLGALNMERVMPSPPDLGERAVPNNQARELRELVNSIVFSAKLPKGTVAKVSRILGFAVPVKREGKVVSQRRTGVKVEISAPHLSTPLTAAYLTVEK